MFRIDKACDKACQLSKNLENDDKYVSKQVQLFIHQTMCLSKTC